VNRQAQAVVMFLVGGAVLRAGSTDLYLRYVKAGLRPLLLMTGVVLIVAAIATVWYELRRPSATPELQPAPADDDRHNHAHREPRISWLLVLPLFALILVAPPALGSYTANRTGTALQPPPGFAPLPSGDPLQLSVVDYAGRAVYDHGRSLGDRQIQITGFITVGPHGTPYLARMVLNCCAADAQPVKVGLTGQVPPVLQPDTWFDIIGTYTDKQVKDDVNGGPIPFINVNQARPVPAPHDQYES
jgi:putative membrane protein